MNDALNNGGVRPMSEYIQEQRDLAAQLWAEAEEDDRLAEEAHERNPSYADYCSQRANHKRWLADNAAERAGDRR